MAFELPPLPYETSALAGAGMCQETLELHHGKHHQAYVTALNGFVEKNANLQGKSLEEIVKLSYGQSRPGSGFQQCRPALEPYPVLEEHVADRRQDARQAGNQDHRRFRRCRRSRTPSRPPRRPSSVRAGLGWCSARDGKLKVTKTPERLQPARHRRGQGAARPRRLGAQLLPGLPQPPPGLRAPTGWTRSPITTSRRTNWLKRGETSGGGGCRKVASASATTAFTIR